MKLYNLFNIILLCFIKSIIAFSQSQLPAGSIIVAKDGSGNFNTVSIYINSYFLNLKFVYVNFNFWLI